MIIRVKVKVKVISQKAWTGPRGFGSVKAPDFHDVRHYKGGRSLAICTGRLYPRRNPWYSFSEAESNPGHMVLSEPRKKSPATPPGIDPGTVRLVAQCLNHYATPGPPIKVIKGKGHPARGRGGLRGSGSVKAPDFLDVRHYKGGRSSTVRTDRLYPRRNP